MLLGVLTRFGRFFFRLGLVVLLVFATFWAITWFFPGDNFFDRLGASYQFLWSNTTRQQFTDIMREKPLLYFAPTVLITLIIGSWYSPGSSGAAGGRDVRPRVRRRACVLVGL